MAIKIAASAALGFAMGAALVAVPTAAQAGFLEQLFGGIPAPAPQAPVFDYDQPTPVYRATPTPARPRRHVVVDSKPKLQKPTELMRDTTLEAGDAVMTKAGLRIYTGDDGVDHHTKADFDPIDDLEGVPKTERVALIALDTTRHDPLRQTKLVDTIASGRSASVAVPISAGHAIVDARGKTVRYVGP